MLDFTTLPHSLIDTCILAALLTACAPDLPRPKTEQPDPGDVHTYANLEEVKVNHIDLDLTVDFHQKKLSGAATLRFDRVRDMRPIILDTRALDIEKVEVSPDNEVFKETTFRLGQSDPILGTPLEIDAPFHTGEVRVHYSTTGGSTALQWLEPRQTAGKRHPFLFTQSEAIHARSWIPLQDSPSVKTTYSARIHTPKGLRAVMSASNDLDAALDGEYEFEMPQPVPSYLIALAVGDLDFRSLGRRTGVYAEKPVIGRAAAEFADTERMLLAAERLFGHYRWGRYDILVLPPSFPFGGMENPRLTFATPTILAGDKSLVSLIAHELAHSWSGNLVTNATWSDFWLNEGFTVYLERRIVEEVYGPERADMEAVLGRQELTAELARLPAPDQILHIDLQGRDPDDGMTSIPYEKGALFLNTLEAAYGRQRLDIFLNGYFEYFAFQSITTKEFRQDLQFHLINSAPAGITVPIEQWLYEPGIPEGAWEPESSAFTQVEEQAAKWLGGRASASSLQTANWTTQHWLHFLRQIPPGVGASKLGRLDAAFRFTQTGNSEILCQWLELAIKNNYQPAYPRLRRFLTSQGRRKFLKPLYEELAKTPEGKNQALDIYRQARSSYHPISVATVDKILGFTGAA